MTQPLTPAAQAVLDAYGGQVGGSAAITSYERRGIAAALRALADQAGSAKHWHVNEIRAIAAELEGADEPTFTPEEVEMIAAPWSYLQSQEELEDNND